AHLLYRQFGFATGDKFGNAAAVPESDLVAHVAGDTEAFQQRHEVLATGTLGGAHDRLRGQQRALEVFNGADGGSGRTLAHRDAEARSAEIDAGLGENFALPCQVADHRSRHDGDVEFFVAIDAPPDGTGRIVTA